jgi:hypothetical protein
MCYAARIVSPQIPVEFLALVAEPRGGHRCRLDFDCCLSSATFANPEFDDAANELMAG